MSSRKLVFYAIAATFAAACGAVHAGTIANWTFESSVPSTPGPITPEVGVGVGTSVHANTGGTHTNPSGNGSPESWNSNFWSIGDYYQFVVSTVNKSGIKFAWDQTRSSAGPGQPSPATPNFRLQYSTDGVNFTNHVDYLVTAPAWDSVTPVAASKFSQDLSSIAALDNQATAYFRLTAIQAPQNTGGQSRVDNIVVSAIVPEPTSLLLLVYAVLASLALPRGMR